MNGAEAESEKNASEVEPVSRTSKPAGETPNENEGTQDLNLAAKRVKRQ
jgi:hypothetical protein